MPKPPIIRLPRCRPVRCDRAMRLARGRSLTLPARSARPAAAADPPTRPRSPRGTRRSFASSSSPRSAGPASRTSRPTSTCSSASRPSRCAGPWNRTDLVKIGPAATDLVDRYEYHLDFPGDPLDAGLRLRALGAPTRRRAREPTVYAHVATDPGYPGQAGAPVLVLLPLQRLQQHARGRLGDDPARLRRRRRATRRSTKSRSRSATARTRAPSAPTGATRSWRSSTARTRSSIRPPARTRTSSRRRSTSAAPRRPGVGCDDTRGPHRELHAGRADDPERPGRGEGGIPVDRLRGPLGRAADGVLQRPDRPEHEGAVDAADRVVARTGATASYAVPAGGVFGTGATDFFCSGVAKGSKGLVLLLRNPALMLLVLAAILGLIVFAVVARDLAAGRAAAHRAAPDAGGRSSPPRRGCTSSAPRLFLGIGLLLIPIAHRDHARCSGSCSAASTCSASSPAQGGRRVRAPRARDRHDAHAARPRARPGGDRVCARRDRRGPADRRRSRAYRIALRRIRPLLGAVALFVVAWVAPHARRRS